LLKTGALLSLVSLLIMMVSFANQLVIAGLFGSSEQMTAYLVAFSVPAVFIGAIGMVFSFGLVPLLVKYRETRSDHQEIVKSFAIAIVAIAAGIAILGAATSTYSTVRLGHSLTAAGMADAVRMSYVFWLNAAATVLLAFFVAVHNVKGRFVAPLLSTGLPYAGMILLGLMFGRRYGAIAIALGMLAGTILGGILLAIGATELSWRWPFRFAWSETRGLFTAMPLIVAAVLCFCIGSVTDAFWAPRLGPKELAYLGYARRLVLVLGSLVAFGPSAVLTPRLAQLHVTGDDKEFRRCTAQSVRLIFMLATPCAMFFSIFCRPIVRAVFERGAFDATTTTGVAGILPYIMLGSVPMACVVILVKSLFARQMVRGAAMASILQAVTYFVLAGVLSGPLGLRGIALAFAISWWTAMIAVSWLLWAGNLHEIGETQNRKFAAQLAASALFAAFASMATKGLLTGQFSPASTFLFHLAVGSLVFWGVFGACAALWFRMPETMMLLNLVYQKLIGGVQDREVHELVS
jgi:putative peptidoglycan lipid II flippase